MAEDPKPPTKPPKQPRKRWPKWLRLPLIYMARAFLVLVVLIILTGFVLSIPAVQNKLVPWSNRKLSSALDTRVSIREVSIGFPDRVIVYDLQVDDQKGLPMLRADAAKVGVISFPLLAWLSSTRKNRPIAARSVELDSPYINLYVSRADSVGNMEFLFSSTDTTDTTASRPLLLEFESVAISDLTFVFADSTLADSNLRATPGTLNYGNLYIENMQLQSSFSMVTGGEMRAYVEELSLQECYSGLNLKHLATDLSTDLGASAVADPDSLPEDAPRAFVKMLHTEIDLEDTHLEGDLSFENESFDSFFDNTHPKTYTFNLGPSKVGFRQIEYFTAGNRIPLNGIATLEGKMTGGPNVLRGRKMKLGIGQQTRLLSDVRLTNYMSDSLLLDLNFKDSQVSPTEVDYLLADIDLPKEALRLGLFQIQGRFIGFINDFVADAAITSAFGGIKTDINLKIDPITDRLSYKGEVVTNNLNLDTLLQASASRRFNFDGRIQGSGTDFDDMDATFDFNLSPSELAGYEMDSAKGHINVKNKIIDGSADLMDRQGSFHAKLTVDNSKARPRYFMVGDLQQADLKFYGLTEDSLSLTTIFNVDLEGDSLEVLSGVVRAFEIRLDDPIHKTNQRVRNVIVSSKLNTATTKNLTIDSQLLDLSLQGNFNYGQAGRLFKRLINETEMFFKNDSAAISSYYASKPLPQDTASIKCQVLVKKLNPLLSFLGTGISIDTGTELQTSFQFGRWDRLAISLSAPAIGMDSLRAHNLGINLALDKPSQANQIVGDGTIQSTRVDITPTFSLDDVFIEPSISNNTIDFGLLAKTDSATKELTLAGFVEFAKGRINGGINADVSRLVINDSLWFFDADNSFSYAPGYLQARNLGIHSLDQEIVLQANISPADTLASGAISPGSDSFTVSVRSLQLARVAELISSPDPFSGVVNLELHLQNALVKPLIRLNGGIENFVYNGFRYGDLTVVSNWSDRLQKLYSRVRLLRDGETLLALEGYYDPNSKTSPLDFFLTTKNLPLNIASPFTTGLIYDLNGLIQIDDVRVKGRLESPIVVGKAQFDNVSFGVDYLKTKYSFSGLIYLQEVAGGTGISFPGKQITITDQTGHTAKLGGSVYDVFGETFLDLRLDQMEDFLVMNTTSKDNDLVYGKAVVSRGNARFEGGISRLKLIAKVTTGSGTDVSLPISFYRKEDRLPYVYFRQTRTDSLGSNIRQADEPLAMDLEIEATPQAKLNMVFNESTGEVISGQGSGVISMNYSHTGEFTMFGSLTIATGKYLLNFENLVNKGFTVENGGTISWTGDPIQAAMNLAAIYRIRVDLSSLDPSQSGKVDVDVYLKMVGSLLKPEISFELKVPNAGQDAIVLNTRLRRFESDPNELNRQVISLLLFGRFAPEQGFFAAGAGSSGVSSSITELISSQLNQWLSKAFDDKLIIKVGTGNALDQVTVNLQAKFLNDRLTFERDGSLVSQSNQDLTIGNLSVRYRLLPGLNDSTARALERKARGESPGVLSVEGFRRENLGFGNTINSIYQGVGLFYRKDFDTFKELLGKKKKTQSADALEEPIDSGFKKKLKTFDFKEMPATDTTKRDTTPPALRPAPAAQPTGGKPAPLADKPGNLAPPTKKEEGPVEE